MRGSIRLLPTVVALVFSACLECRSLHAQSDGPLRATARATTVIQNAQAAGDLLDKAPTGSPREGTISADEFLARASEFRGSPLGSVEEAVMFLEWTAKLAGSVPVVAQSVPAGLTIRYHRTYQAARPNDPTLTTDTIESLDVPTYYVFEARNPYTNQVVQQTKNCLRSCTVRFVVSPPASP